MGCWGPQGLPETQHKANGESPGFGGLLDVTSACSAASCTTWESSSTPLSPYLIWKKMQMVEHGSAGIPEEAIREKFQDAENRRLRKWWQKAVSALLQVSRLHPCSLQLPTSTQFWLTSAL